MGGREKSNYRCQEEERSDGSGTEASVFSIMCNFSGLGAVLGVEADTMF